jgi:hypothetical protein
MHGLNYGNLQHLSPPDYLRASVYRSVHSCCSCRTRIGFDIRDFRESPRPFRRVGDAIPEHLPTSTSRLLRQLDLRNRGAHGCALLISHVLDLDD